jgi:hypothetical protein
MGKEGKCTRFWWKARRKESTRKTEAWMGSEWILGDWMRRGWNKFSWLRIGVGGGLL